MSNDRDAQSTPPWESWWEVLGIPSEKNPWPMQIGLFLGYRYDPDFDRDLAELKMHPCGTVVRFFPHSLVPAAAPEAPLVKAPTE
jgi:hypothetical protein